LQAAIAARIDRLEPDAKKTLNAAAVIGSRFTTELLAAVGDDPVLDELLKAELIDQIRFTPSTEFAFRHPLIRTVAYQTQLKSDRAACIGGSPLRSKSAILARPTRMRR
jgi:predicted ATPase